MCSNYSERVKNGSIAIVDDEKDLLFVYRKALQHEGFKVVTFDNPLIALKEISEHYKKYYLVISDIHMNSINGYQLVNKIKTIDPLIKVFLISAYDISESEVSQNLHKGIEVQGVFRKPISLKYLLNVVKEISDNTLANQ